MLQVIRLVLSSNEPAGCQGQRSVKIIHLPVFPSQKLILLVCRSYLCALSSKLVVEVVVKSITFLSGIQLS